MSKIWTDYECFVMFYEHDVKFERLWNNPKKYLDRLKKFKGVISPDFSLYRNMPIVMQIWNTYRSRALASWFQNNGIRVIPNVRFNDIRTFYFCFDGIEKNNSNLKESIRKSGITESIKYVEYKGEKYVVDGHHRLRAAKELGLKNVPIEKVSLPYKSYKKIEDLLWYD